MIPYPNSSRPPWRHLLIVFGIAFLLGSSLWLLNGCAARHPFEQDPYARYRPALKSAFQSHFDQLGSAPRYELDVVLEPSGDLLYGSAQVTVHNEHADPWNNLVFRLYPMLKQYGGNMVILSALVNGQPTPFVYQEQSTAILIGLPEPLYQNEGAIVELTWRLEIPTWADTPGIYALFGKSQQMMSLPLFYPSLAVYQPGATLGSGQWWMETGSVRGDAAFNLISLFVVTATLPADQTPVASGTLLSSTPTDDNQVRHIWVTGPTREFLLHTSPQFSSTFTEAYGTRVASYWLPGQEAAGRAALEYAVSALRVYSDYYGPYPFRDMRVAAAPLSNRGMEYPQVNLLGVELYNHFGDNLEILVAHEVAHQWWYQMVHNDPVKTPWLDEALAEYSVKLYFEALHGEGNADDLQNRRWQTPARSLQEREVETPLGWGVESFADGSQYEITVYGKGALFYDALRKILGERQFKRFLQSYLETYRYQIVDANDWLAAIRALQNPAVETLYEEWVTPTEPEPLPPASESPSASP